MIKPCEGLPYYVECLFGRFTVRDVQLFCIKSDNIFHILLLKVYRKGSLAMFFNYFLHLVNCKKHLDEVQRTLTYRKH